MKKALQIQTEMDTLVNEAFQTPNRHDKKRNSPHYIRVKILKIQNKE